MRQPSLLRHDSTVSEESTLEPSDDSSRIILSHVSKSVFSRTLFPLQSSQVLHTVDLYSYIVPLDLE